jgi:hypothetical protein
MEQFYPQMDENEDEENPTVAYLKGLKNPARGGPEFAPRKNQEYTIDDRVRDYLQRSSQRPQDYRSPAMIDAAMLGGIAGGAAQLGTTFGMTPSAEPFQRAAMQAAQSIPPPSQARMEIDPVVAQYLKSKKPAQFRPSGISAEGRNIYLDPSTGEEKEGTIARQIQEPEVKDDWVSTGKVDAEGNLIYLSRRTGKTKLGPKVQTAPQKPAQLPTDIIKTEWAKTSGKTLNEDIQALKNSEINFKELQTVIQKYSVEGEDPSFFYKLTGPALAEKFPGPIEEIQAQLQPYVLSQAENLKGAISDSDREFLKSGVFNRNFSKEANLGLLQKAVRIIEAGIQQKRLNIKKAQRGEMPSIEDTNSELTPEEKRELELRRQKKQGGP